ncbi:MAG TPA: AraC family transcriptional regulator [Solirubrobacterales bacterium]|jgi:AraC-like DNA-binding protein
MSTEAVRIWRPTGEARVVLIAGRTLSYAVEPRGEYVFGLIESGAMRSRRGRERRLIGAGELVAWDPSAPHSGSGASGEPWTARLLVIEAPALDGALADPESPTLVRGAFPDPVIADRRLAGSFRRMHRALAPGVAQLELEERLGGWLREATASAGDGPPATPPAAADLRALQLARDFVGEEFRREIGLDELAAAAGIGKFRLVRLFRERFGLPPHALQIAHRVRAARLLLEQGEPIAAAAAETGFADQSHLHRHFRRTLGMTPAQYRRRACGGGPAG